MPFLIMYVMVISVFSLLSHKFGFSIDLVDLLWFSIFVTFGVAALLLAILGILKPLKVKIVDKLKSLKVKKEIEEEIQTRINTASTLQTKIITKSVPNTASESAQINNVREIYRSSIKKEVPVYERDEEKVSTYKSKSKNVYQKPSLGTKQQKEVISDSAYTELFKPKEISGSPVVFLEDNANEKAKYLGDKGERVVNKELDKLKFSGDYTVLSNINLWKSGEDKKPAQIDHLVISKYGIFVIETKNYGGTIQGHVFDEYWTVKYSNGYGSLYNPIRQNSGHLYAVKQTVISVVDESIFIKETTAGKYDYYSGIFSIVVFTRRSNRIIDGVEKEIITDTSSLIKVIRSFENKVLFKDEDIKKITKKIKKENVEVFYVKSKKRLH